jgi:hypothetical protein
VISFVDELLDCISDTYWSSVDKVQSSAGEKMVALRNKEAMVEARVSAIGNKELSAIFRELTKKRLEIGTLLHDGKISEAIDKKQEVYRLAGQILSKLHDKNLEPSGG